MERVEPAHSRPDDVEEVLEGNTIYECGGSVKEERIRIMIISVHCTGERRKNKNNDNKCTGKHKKDWEGRGNDGKRSGRMSSPAARKRVRRRIAALLREDPGQEQELETIRKII